MAKCFKTGRWKNRVVYAKENARDWKKDQAKIEEYAKHSEMVRRKNRGEEYQKS